MWHSVRYSQVHPTGRTDVTPKRAATGRQVRPVTDGSLTGAALLAAPTTLIALVASLLTSAVARAAALIRLAALALTATLTLLSDDSSVTKSAMPIQARASPRSSA